MTVDNDPSPGDLHAHAGTQGTAPSSPEASGGQGHHDGPGQAAQEGNERAHGKDSTARTDGQDQSDDKGQERGQEHSPDPKTRTRIRIIGIGVGVLLVGAAVVWFMSWFLHGRFHVVTDDAYAGGDQVQVNAMVAGTVVSIAADDTDQVSAGQLVIELDASDADLEVQSASAALGSAVRAVRERQADAERADAQAMIAELEEHRTGGDLIRRIDGSHDGTLSEEDVEHASIALAESKASSEAARSAHAAMAAQVDGTSLTDHPQVEQAVARLRMALLAKQRSRIVAPCSGMVARRLVQVGQRIQPGQPLMSIISLDHLWVDANFKESQLRGVEAGQMAIVHADLYGSRITYHARVQGLEAGTGAAFALLPAQNATGNWIKIVQRLPVRLALDPAELRQHPLRIGLSLRVDIGIGQQPRSAPGERALTTGRSTSPPSDGASGTAPAPNPDRSLRMEVPLGLSSAADAVIRRIIEKNGSPQADVPVKDVTESSCTTAPPPVSALDDIR